MSRRIPTIAALCFCLFMLILLLASFACEPETKVTFQNQRNEDVKLFVAHVRGDGSIDALTDYGTITAQTTKAIFITFLGDEWVNRLEIRDSMEKVLLSRDYIRADLEKIGWKITIPP